MFRLLALFLALMVATARAIVVTTPDPKNWWAVAVDRPARYENHFARMADGRVVFANSSRAMQPRHRETTSPLQQWRLSKNGSRTLKTVRNLVRDAEMGKVAEGRIRMADGSKKKVANPRNAGKGMLGQLKKSPLMMEAATDAVKGVLRLIKRKYTGYIEGEIRKIVQPKYSALELHEMFMEQYNLSWPKLTAADYKEVTREKNVKSYEWVGDRCRLFFKIYSTRFQPFRGYGNVYYTPDDDLPEPTVPAPSYPWRWSEHLAVVRDIALGVITTRESTANTKREEIDDGEGDKFELPTTLLPPSLQAQKDEEDKQRVHLKRLGTDNAYFRKTMREQHQKDGGGDSSLPLRRRLHQMTNDSDAVGDNVGTVSTPTDSDDSLDDNEEFIDEQTLDTMERVTILLNQFHFSSGIPRFVMQKNDSRRLFPSFEAYQRNVSKYLKSALQDQQGEDLYEAADELVESEKSSEAVDELVESEKKPEAKDEIVETPMYHTDDGKHLIRRHLVEDTPSAVHVQRQDTSEYSFEGDDTIYSALLDFYAYPAVDKELLVVDDEDMLEAGFSSRGEIPECKLLEPCRMQSGVTVYTPVLSNLSVFSFFANPNAPTSLASPTAVRMAGLREMVETAFTMEKEALRHGLQSPSTVWYSMYDQQSDEFADALVGSANMSNATEVLSPSATFERFYNKRKSLIDLLPSYYQNTVRTTIYVMDTAKSVPKPTNFSEPELVEFMDFILEQINSLDEAVTAYKRIRERDSQRQALVDEIQRREFYYGSEYTLLGFGYVMPQTNSKNAVLRDMRLPVGLHLLVRLFTRFHESRVLLPEESNFVLACLALLLNDTPYYRCRPRRAPPAPIID